MADIFDKNRIYVLESVNTNNLYIDDEFSCHLYIKPNDAEEAIREFAGTRVSNPKYYAMSEIGSLCYAAGAATMTVHSGDQKEVLPLIEERLKPAFYNHALMAVLSRIKQTYQKKYLYQLATCDFIVPVKIVQDDKQSVDIHYGIARHPQTEDILYLTFSTEDEFNVWTMDQNKWKPLKVSYKRLRNICGDNGIVVNPSGNRLVLSKDLLNEIDNKREEKKEGK